MKKNIIRFFIFILVLTNCTTENGKTNKINHTNYQDTINYQKNTKNIKKISDSISQKSVYYQTDKAESLKRNIQFIGQNNIQYNNIKIKKLENSSIPVRNNLIPENSIILESKYVSLEVDTTQIVNLSEYDTAQKINRIDFQMWLKEMKYNYFKSYPIILKNLSINDSLTIGYAWRASIYLQAKRQDGKWIDVELPCILDCGVGVQTIYLKPNEFSISLGLIYAGNFKTKLRYRFRNFYSNEFDGRINKSQLLE